MQTTLKQCASCGRVALWQGALREIPIVPVTDIIDSARTKYFMHIASKYRFSIYFLPLHNHINIISRGFSQNI